MACPYPVLARVDELGNTLASREGRPDMVNTTCVECSRSRTDADLDYHPLQPVMGQPCGWYSGDDAEMCGHCMDTILKGQR